MLNWKAYLIRPTYLKWLAKQSTHWRATCRYETDGVVYRDYMRTSLANFDIINIPVPISGKCYQFKILNIQGYECVLCTAPLWNKEHIHSLHTDSYKKFCEFYGNTGAMWSTAKITLVIIAISIRTFVALPVQSPQFSCGSGDSKEEFEEDS